MRNRSWSMNQRHLRRTGAMIVLIAFTLPLMLIMIAFAVDLAWMQLVRAELRTATDAASRAGAKSLSLEHDVDLARATAVEAASRNKVAGTPLVLSDPEIIFGSSDQTSTNSRFVFTPGGTQMNAVQVAGSRTASSAGGPVALFFGHHLGVFHFQPLAYTTTSTQLDRDICLVVDRSGSMMRELDTDAVPGDPCDPPHPTLSRWSGLVSAVEGFVSELVGTTLQELFCLSWTLSGNDELEYSSPQGVHDVQSQAIFP